MRKGYAAFVRAKRRGFTLVEVIVALVIVLTLAAVAVPSLTGYLDEKAVEESATQLAIVRDALYNTAAGTVAFRQTVTRNAGRLSQLSDSIVGNNGLYLNSCGAQFSNAQATNWKGSGPFVNFRIDRTSGMATPIGTASDVLTRNPAAGGVGTLRITFTNSVEVNHATLLDQYIDASNGNAAGTVQWLAPVDGKVTMYYFVSIDATC